MLTLLKRLLALAQPLIIKHYFSKAADLDAAIESAIRKGYGAGVFIRDHGQRRP